jgi:hypothetical protein
LAADNQAKLHFFLSRPSTSHAFAIRRAAFLYGSAPCN